MSFGIIGQYRDYQGAQSYDLGLELAVPVTIWRPVKAAPYFWQLTPFFQAAGGGRFRYIPALNARPDHLDALMAVLQRELGGWSDGA